MNRVIKIDDTGVVEQLWFDVTSLAALEDKYGLSGSEYEVSDMAEVGMTKQDGVFVAPTFDLSPSVRLERDFLLEGVDAIAGNALRWAALTSAKQAEWSTYRQALLDVPQQAGFPDNITWPTKP